VGIEGELLLTFVVCTRNTPKKNIAPNGVEK